MREVGLNVAALHIALGKRQAGHDGLGNLPGEDGNTGVVVGFCVEKVCVKISRVDDIVRQLIFLGAQILNGNDIGVCHCQPCIQAFIYRLLQSVYL